MTTSNGSVKNAETAGASNFDLYAGDFSCDDDISFENLLQLDNDIDKPPPPPTATALHQGTPPAAAQICRQPAPTAMPTSIAGPPADTVVYLLTPSALRPPAPPSSTGDPVYDMVARNDVRPLLRFQISKRPTTAAAMVGYGVELGGAVCTAQSRAPVAVGLQTGVACDVGSDRVAGSLSSSDGQRRLALTTAAFNGDLTTATQRSLAAAVTPPGARPAKSTQPPLSGAVGSKSKSAAAADARQTVQEKNAYEYERVMDILRYYRELVVERKLPGACLPCKRRKSKPLVSADPVTPICTRPVPVTPTTTTVSRTVTVPGTQYIRPVAMAAWRGQASASSGLGPVTSASTTSTSRPTAAHTPPNGDTSTMSSVDHDSNGRTVPWLGDLTSDDPPSRPSSVELGTVQSHPVNDELADCSKDLTRTCSSAPGLCADDDDRHRNLLTVYDGNTSPDPRRRLLNVLSGNRRHRTQRRSVDLRRFVRRPPTFLHRDPRARKTENRSDSGGDAQIKDEVTDGSVSAWMKPALPVKQISTQTTDTVVVKWTKAHLAISGPYQSST